MGLRKTILIAGLDQYVGMAAGIVTLMITARLMTPADFGAAVIGLSVLGIMDILRGLGGTAYIIQADEVTPEKVQTVFTISLLLTILLALLMLVFSGTLAAYYGVPGIATFFQVGVLCYLCGPIIGPINALLRRELKFGRITLIGVVSSIVNSLTTVGLAVCGFGFMSFAWAAFAASATSLAMYWCARPSTALFRLSLARWRQVVAFGGFDGVKNLMYHCANTVPMIVFGKTLGTEGLGLYHRAVATGSLPERVILAGLYPVLLPALSRKVREGHELKRAYLRGLAYISGVLWPCLAILIILPTPVVATILGHQWLQAVPLVQIIATALIFSFPTSLTNPTLIATGFVKDTFILALAVVPIVIAIQIAASRFGAVATSCSLLLTVPLFSTCQVIAVRRRVPFRMAELIDALSSSAIAAFASMIGPVIIAVGYGGVAEVTIGGGAVGLLLAAAGWLAGLGATRHPLWLELMSLAGVVMNGIPVWKRAGSRAAPAADPAGRQ